ncbi:MAG: hypothetical protein ABW128_21130 [Rhizorhabdus sp.]
MSASDEWVILECGERLHRDTIENRIHQQGWTEHAARTTPMGRHGGKNGEPNAASAFRKVDIAPREGRKLMKDYGVSVDDAIDHLTKRADG